MRGLAGSNKLEAGNQKGALLSLSGKYPSSAGGAFVAYSSSPHADLGSFATSPPVAGGEGLLKVIERALA